MFTGFSYPFFLCKFPGVRWLNIAIFTLWNGRTHITIYFDRLEFEICALVFVGKNINIINTTKKWRKQNLFCKPFVIILIWLIKLVYFTNCIKFVECCLLFLVLLLFTSILRENHIFLKSKIIVKFYTILFCCCFIRD